MKNYKISKGLAIFVAITGAIVMLGWIFNIGILKSILPVWVTMKFTTAVCFVLSGITLYLIAISFESKFDIAQVFLPITILIILLIMGVYLASTFLGLRLKIGEIFIKEANGAVRSVVSGRPSVPTMISFILVATAGILTMLNLANLKSKLRFLGWIIIMIGTVAVLGYLVNAPFLYYYIKGKTTAMALHTAILFTLTGISLVFLGGKKQLKH
ncbi:MAG: hypothetical protein ABH882_07575 [Candidatus Omnitrophota bacterium]